MEICKKNLVRLGVFRGEAGVLAAEALVPASRQIAPSSNTATDLTLRYTSRP